MPVFNCEEFVLDSVNSIINSSFRNFEIVLVNDGSTDSTIDKLKFIQDDRIKIYNKRNSGLVESLNYGLKKCNYEIIMRMDGDDLIHHKKIETQLNYFLKNQAILVGTQGFTIDLNKKKTGVINLPLSHKKIIQSLLNFSSGLIHPSIMFYKDALLKIGGYNKNFEHAEDYDMYLQLSKIGEISNIYNKLIYLRKHNTNVSFLHAEQQIKNSIISREIYLKSNTLKISEEIYIDFKRKTDGNIIYRVYIKIQKTIVKLENKNNQVNLLSVISLKIIRRILKYFL